MLLLLGFIEGTVAALWTRVAHFHSFFILLLLLLEEKRFALWVLVSSVFLKNIQIRVVGHG